LEKRYNRIIKFYNTISRIYDLLGVFEWDVIEKGLNLVELDRCEYALDIGCGTGRVLKWLSNKCKAVVGLDIASGMIRVAKKKLEGKINASLLLADALYPPFRDESFDLVTSVFTLEILAYEDLMKTLTEALRILRKGGKFLAISILDKPCRSIKVYKFLGKLFPTIFNCKPIKLDGFLRDVGFNILVRHEVSLYGFPIIIIIARKE